MESSDRFNIVEDALYNWFFIIDVIIRDNCRKMRAVLNHPSKGALVQVLKSSKGKLDKETSKPSLREEPYHCVKVLAKHIFSIVNASRAQKFGCNKADTLWLKKYWGYTIKINRENELKNWARQVRFLLNTCLTIMKNLLHIGASIKDHHNKQRHIMTKMTIHAAKKTAASCKISWNDSFYHFKQTEL